MECIQLSLFGKTCQGLSVLTEEKISEPCWKNLPAWKNQTLQFLDLRRGADGAKPEQSSETDGLWLGDSSMLNTGEKPSMTAVQEMCSAWGPHSAAKESLLSQILEDNVPEKYYLSARACQGILTRASRRGKKLPDLLQTALLEMIEWWEPGSSVAVVEMLIAEERRRTEREKSGAFTVNTVDRHAVAYALQNQNLCIDDVLPFDTTQITSKVNKSNPQWGDPCHPLAAAAHPQAAVIRISDEEMPVQPMVLESNQVHATVTQNGICPTLPASMGLGGGYVPMITERKIFDARENGDGQIVPIITGNHESRITDYTAIAVDLYNGAVTGDIAAAITCRSIASHSGPQVMEIYGIGNGQAHASVTKEKSGTLDTMHDAQAVAIEYMELPKKITWIVRRLTPTECERLQGYPDGWTDIGEWTDTKGKKHKPADSQRYKALGNSIALPQWFWLVQKMRPYLKEKPTLGSLFDGLGGFPLVWQRAYGEGTARWASEIESFCVAVTKRRFGEE